MLENTNLVEKYLNPVTSWGQRSKLSKPPNTGICAILRLHHFRATAPQEGPWGRNGWWAILRNNTSSHFHTKQNQVAQMSIHCDTDNIKRVMIKALPQAVFTISTISWRVGEEQLSPGARVAQNSRLSPSFPLNTLDRIVWCNPLKGACLGHNIRQFLQPQGLF